MTTLLRVSVLTVIAACSAISAIAQSLNPTVTVLRQANSVVAADCVDPEATPVQRAQADVPAAPRVVPAPADRTAVAQPANVAVRTGSLRDELRVAHGAALARDRAGYDAAISTSKSLLANAGNDRETAAAVLTLFDDVTRLWDYQLNAPVGSFFDASVQGGSLLRALTRHNGYEDFVRRQVITDASGTRYYPTRESIEFLLSLVASRLGGIRAVPAPSRDVTVDRSQTAPQPPRGETPSAGTASSRETPRVTTGAENRKPASTTVRKSRPASSTALRGEASARRSTTTRSRSAATPRKTTATAREVAPSNAEEPPLPKGVVSSPSASSEPPDAATSAETATDTAAVSTAVVTEVPVDQTSTVDTTTEPGTTSAPAQTPPQPRRRSVILPVVLILIGVGVLIVLFRASA